MRRPAPSRGKRPQQGPTRLSTLPSCRHSFPLPLCSPPDEWTARANWRYGISAMRCTNEHEPLRLSSTFRLLALFAPSGNQKRGKTKAERISQKPGPRLTSAGEPCFPQSKNFQGGRAVCAPHQSHRERLPTKYAVRPLSVTEKRPRVSGPHFE